MNTEEKNDFIIAGLDEKLTAAKAEIERLNAECRNLRDSYARQQKQIEEERKKTSTAQALALRIFRAMFPQERFIFEPSPALKLELKERYSYNSSAWQWREDRKHTEEIEQFSKAMPKVIEYVQQIGKLRDQAKLAPLLVLLLLNSKGTN